MSPAVSIDSLAGRTRAVVAAFALVGASALASASAAFLQVRALRGVSAHAIDLAAVERADLVARAAGVAVVASSLAGLVAWALWARRAFDLAGALGLRGLPMSAARAAWGFVLPLAQLWVPLQALAGLGRALDRERIPAEAPRAASETSSHYRDNAQAPRPPDVALPPSPVGAAWAFWWGGWALSFVATFAHGRAASVADMRAVLQIDLTSQLGLALAALFFARVAVALHARLRERAERWVPTAR
ncbi:MAG: DUF4328 domain-containing protein [Polyangiales bacterium]